MRDPVIREALHKKILRKYHEDTNSIVLDEFGINHGAIRADIAVVNGILHGYEIKGSSDKLNRLPAQAEAYSSIFDKVTLVLSESHLDDALKMVPDWWGICIAQAGKREALHFHSYRRGTLNRKFDAEKIARLLWHSEAAQLLEKNGFPKSLLKQSRSVLYKQIAEACSEPELKAYVLHTLKQRRGWRGHSLPL